MEYFNNTLGKWYEIRGLPSCDSYSLPLLERTDALFRQQNTSPEEAKKLLEGLVRVTEKYDVRSMQWVEDKGLDGKLGEFVDALRLKRLLSAFGVQDYATMALFLMKENPERPELKEARNPFEPIATGSHYD